MHRDLVGVPSHTSGGTVRTGQNIDSLGGGVVSVICLEDDAVWIDSHFERVSSSRYARDIDPLPVKIIAVDVSPPDGDSL